MQVQNSPLPLPTVHVMSEKTGRSCWWHSFKSNLGEREI